MTILQILPVLAYAGTIAAVFAAAQTGGAARPGLWRIPAVAAALFWAFSLITVAQEGLVQFWVNHTTTFAGNQVWFDLLVVVALVFFVIAPRAKAVDMRLWPWAIATVCVAGLALLPMLARLLYLEGRAQA
jgi:hypothetical protein